MPLTRRVYTPSAYWSEGRSTRMPRTNHTAASAVTWALAEKLVFAPLLEEDEVEGCQQMLAELRSRLRAREEAAGPSGGSLAAVVGHTLSHLAASSISSILGFAGIASEALEDEVAVVEERMRELNAQRGEPLAGQCDVCSGSADDAVTCGSCRWANYCSEACAEAHTAHKPVCACLVRMGLAKPVAGPRKNYLRNMNARSS